MSAIYELIERKQYNRAATLIRQLPPNERELMQRILAKLLSK